MKNNYRINCNMWMLYFAVISSLFSVGVFCKIAFAQGGVQAASQALSSYGLEKVEVSLLENCVLISYLQRISEFNTLDEVAVRIAEITQTVSNRLPAQKNVCIHQHFDDGQILQITIAPEDARGVLNGQLPTETFLDKVEMKPLTRGAPIVPGRCEPDKGMNCNNSEACTCYPNEVCAPNDPRANSKGCVEKHTPSNAHLVGSEYVCNKGYEWDTDLTGCVQVGGGSKIPATGKPQVPTTSGNLSTEPFNTIINQTLLLDSIPPSPFNQKEEFSLGDTMYVWIETQILQTPHKLEIVWNHPSGKETKRETFNLRGWGEKETFWSELQTGRQMMQGRWKVDILIDGRVDRIMSLILKP